MSVKDKMELPFDNGMRARMRRDRGTFSHSELILLTRWLDDTGADATTVADAVEKPWKWWDDYATYCLERQS